MERCESVMLKQAADETQTDRYCYVMNEEDDCMEVNDYKTNDDELSTVKCPRSGWRRRNTNNSDSCNSNRRTSSILPWFKTEVVIPAEVE